MSKNSNVLFECIDEPYILLPASKNIVENENEKSDIAIYALARNMGEGLDRRPIKGEVFLTNMKIIF